MTNTIFQRLILKTGRNAFTCCFGCLKRGSLLGLLLMFLFACGSPAIISTKNSEKTGGVESENTAKEEPCNGEGAANQLIVKFRQQNPAKSLGEVQNLVGSIVAENVSAESLGEGVMLIRWKSERSVKDLKEKLLDGVDSQLIEYVEPDYLVPLDCAEPGQGHNTHLTKQWGHDKTNTCAAWSVSTGEDVVVAVIDSGIACDQKDSKLRCHNDLKDNLWPIPSGFSVQTDGKEITCPGNCFGFDAMAAATDDDTKKWNPKDYTGHGTKVAGIIAAGDNDMGVVGVSFKTKLLVIRYASEGDGFVSSVRRAINFIIAAKEKIPNLRVVNCSFGFEPGRDHCDSQTLRDSFELLQQEGILVVASNGNRDERTSRPHYPSQYEFSNIIAVSPTTQADDLFPSAYNTESLNLIGAPGDGIFTTVGNDYDLSFGSSFAAPYVTGAAALVISNRKNGCDRLTAANLRRAILETADQRPKLKPYIPEGRRLNVLQAVTRCKEYLN